MSGSSTIANGSSVRRWAILVDGIFADAFFAKTAHGMIRYSRDNIVCVIDSNTAGRSVSDVVPSLRSTAPVVASVKEALALAPTSLLLGSAPIGGALPETFRSAINEAIDQGLEIVSGLHTLLNSDPEFSSRAAQSGAKLWDVRVPLGDPRVFTGSAYEVPQVVALAVGTDCSSGKMSAMLELRSAADRSHAKAAFVATGQTGILINGNGIAVDRVIADFVAGAAEQLVCEVSADIDYTLVEGQGAVYHPAYAAVTYGLLTGAAPDLLLLCHRVGQTTINGYSTPIPDLRDVIDLHESYLSFVKPARCVMVALNTASLALDDAKAEISALSQRLGLPVDDPVRFGGDFLWAQLASAAQTTPKRLTVHRELA